MEKLEKKKRILIAIPGILMATLVVPPIFKLVNKIEPWILGLPFFVFWIVVINITIATILIQLRKIDKQIRELEAKK